MASRPEAILCMLFLISTAPILSEAPLEIQAFEGWEEWPLLVPGDLDLETQELSQLRIEYDSVYPVAGSEEEEVTRLFLDVLEVYFRGRPSLWIEWVFTPDPPDSGEEDVSDIPVIDTMVVDKETFEFLFRIGAAGRAQDWGGDYFLLHAYPDRLLQVTVNEKGQTLQTSETPKEMPVFQFATYGFLFPFLDLEEGAHWRLAGYHHGSRTALVRPVRVRGRTTIEAHDGSVHEAWAVETMSTDQEHLVTLFVTTEAPYFYGWHYQRVKDGSFLNRMKYRGMVSTRVGGASSDP